MTRSCLSIVLAAGEGTRMKSSKTKVLHEVAGLPLVCHAVAAAKAAGSTRVALVTGRAAAEVERVVAARFGGVTVHQQTERLGTAHAVIAARAAILEGFDDVLVLFGDTPLISPETLHKSRAEIATGAAVCVLGFRTSAPQGYGRLIVESGELAAIREEKDANEAERAIDLCNGGVMALDGRTALTFLDAIGNANAKGEFYLTDIVEKARAGSRSVRIIEASEEELLGVNTRVELAAVEGLWQTAKRRELMLAGVTMIAPDTVFLSHDTAIGADVVIEPNVVFGPGVSVAAGAIIHAFCHIEGATIASGASVGPFARLRPGADLGAGSKVGNFCEVKNAVVEAGAKVNHLTYVGDARIGARANIGAGTITCNYDGANKHHTDIGADVFVGSNSSLVAPVSIGDGAYIASGSVVTEDVPADALAIARGRQVTKEGRGREIRDRNAAAKKARAMRP